MSAPVTQCVICGKSLNIIRPHVDTCGERCFQELLKRQRSGGFAGADILVLYFGIVMVAMAFSGWANYMNHLSPVDKTEQVAAPVVDVAPDGTEEGQLTPPRDCLRCHIDHPMFGDKSMHNPLDDDALADKMFKMQPGRQP
jgi:predicted nucleic acid-binding Zn ribbon protein